MFEVIALNKKFYLILQSELPAVVSLAVLVRSFCKVSLIVEELAKEYEGSFFKVGKINVDENNSVAKEIRRIEHTHP